MFDSVIWGGRTVVGIVPYGSSVYFQLADGRHKMWGVQQLFGICLGRSIYLLKPL